MIAVADRRDAWVGPKAEPENDYERAWVGNGNLNKSEMALFSECTHGYASKMLDTADIVREAIYRLYGDSLATSVEDA